MENNHTKEEMLAALCRLTYSGTLSIMYDLVIKSDKEFLSHYVNRCGSVFRFVAVTNLHTDDRHINSYNDAIEAIKASDAIDKQMFRFSIITIKEALGYARQYNLVIQDHCSKVVKKEILNRMNAITMMLFVAPSEKENMTLFGILDDRGILAYFKGRYETKYVYVTYINPITKEATVLVYDSCQRAVKEASEILQNHADDFTDCKVVDMDEAAFFAIDHEILFPII